MKNIGKKKNSFVEQEVFDEIDAYFYHKFVRFMFTLTKFPPFYFFLRDKTYHYKNKDLWDMQQKFLGFVKKERIYFITGFCNRNRDFLYIIGKFEDSYKLPNFEKRVKKVAERCKKEGMFVNWIGENVIKVMIPRE